MSMNLQRRFLEIYITGPSLDGRSKGSKSGLAAGEGKVDHAPSKAACVFGREAGTKLGKSPSEEDSNASPRNPRLVYVRYKDHVLFKNILEPAAEAVERETIGWLTKQNDELMLIEHDRAIPGNLGGVNGVVILKSCILEMQALPLQKSSSWYLNCKQNKGKIRVRAPSQKERKTQPKTTKREGKNNAEI
jgi:hypothetical protein